uniref:Uncharacterized protein n=1 Tax=Pithovirus LCPAC101 TaxID=2506586 RepID=A0A481Z318_9VIRU|nr:MAG: hypothetical protein LCPAC101_01780 [Pithovirus LCPAC101]
MKMYARKKSKRSAKPTPSPQQPDLSYMENKEYDRTTRNNLGSVEIRKKVISRRKRSLSPDPQRPIQFGDEDDSPYTQNIMDSKNSLPQLVSTNVLNLIPKVKNNILDFYNDNDNNIERHEYVPLLPKNYDNQAKNLWYERVIEDLLLDYKSVKNEYVIELIKLYDEVLSKNNYKQIISILTHD